MWIINFFKSKFFKKLKLLEAAIEDVNTEANKITESKEDVCQYDSMPNDKKIVAIIEKMGISDEFMFPILKNELINILKSNKSETFKPLENIDADVEFLKTLVNQEAKEGEIILHIGNGNVTGNTSQGYCYTINSQDGSSKKTTYNYDDTGIFEKYNILYFNEDSKKILEVNWERDKSNVDKLKHTVKKFDIDNDKSEPKEESYSYRVSASENARGVYSSKKIILNEEAFETDSNRIQDIERDINEEQDVNIKKFIEKNLENIKIRINNELSQSMLPTNVFYDLTDKKEYDLEI